MNKPAITIYPDGTKTENWLNKNRNEIGRLAPIIGNITDKVERGSNPYRDRIFGNIQPNLINEEAALAPVRDVVKTGMNAARGAAGGDSALLMKMLTGMSSEGAKAIGNQSMAVKQANQSEKGRAQQLNLNRLFANQQANFADETDALANEGAYQTAKSASRSALFEDIGKVFKEEGDKNLVKEMFGYGWDGEYFRDDAGNIVQGKDGKPLTIEEMKQRKVIIYDELSLEVPIDELPKEEAPPIVKGK